MRMRRKRNLDSFVEQSAPVLLTPVFSSPNPVLAAQKPQYLDLPALFGSRPLELEIGCGKGQFICRKAMQEPGKGFLAVEVSKNVIVEGCRKAMELGLENVRFLNCPAEFLSCLLPQGCTERIYLNFSCPYPKATYEAHRLTHPRFLEIYTSLLSPAGEVHQKTDNMHFFEYSLESLSQCGFGLKNISLDLHHAGFEENIVTEYEQRFAAQGLPIYRVEAYRR